MAHGSSEIFLPTGRKGLNKVLIEWESGERTWEPIREIFRVDKYFLADYTREHNLGDMWDSKGIVTI